MIPITHRGTISSKLKVMHVINSLDFGGAERNLLSVILNYQWPENIMHHVAYGDGGLLENDFLNANVLIDRISENKLNFVSPKIFSIINRLVFCIRKYKINIIHSHLFVASFYGLLAARLTGAKFVNHIHTNLSDDQGNRKTGILHQKLFAFISGHADINIPVTNQTCQLLRKGGIHNSRNELVHNGITIPKPEQISPEKIHCLLGRHSISEEIVVCSIGRLDQNKNHELLLYAFSDLLQRFNRLLLIIVGDGPEYSHLRSLAAELGIENRVIFTGYLSDVFPVLAASHVFVLPSRYELFPVSVLEAMAMKKPVVVPSVGGLPDIITNGKNGILFDSDDRQSLTRSIEYVLANPEEATKIGEYGYETINNGFLIGSSCKKIESIYTKLMT